MKKEDNAAEAAAEVAMLGPPGTFTEEAAKKMFPKKRLMYCDTVEDVFDEVDKGIEYGVVAVENSLEGSVNTTLDCLLNHDLNIYREVILDIHLNLFAKAGAKKEDIESILSHPHALAQCRRFLKMNYPNAKLKGCESTTAAAKEVREASSGKLAAIGPKQAAALYGLAVIQKDIEDAPSQTRFLAISKKKGRGNKTSIIFMVKDRPGTLYEVLRDFAQAGINLSKIESRPSKKKLGEYSFYVDLQGSLLDEEVIKVLDELEKKTTFLKILGSY